MKFRILVLLSILPLSSPLWSQNLLTYTLPEGNTILQLSGADAINTTGGPATSELRTLYYLSNDFGDPQPNTHDWTSNTAWPYVFITGALTIQAGITATVTTFDDGDALTGDVLLIDGNPVYQFINDNSTTDANGNFGPWYFIQPDGTATQSTVPEPGTSALLLGFLGLAFVVARRLRLRR